MIRIGEFGTLHLNDEPQLMNSATRLVSFIIGPISCLAGIFVTLSFIASKNLRNHASFLIILISVCESASTFYMILGALNISQIITDVGLNWLLYYLSFGFSLESRDRNRITILESNTEILCKANNLAMSVFSLGSVIFNTCMCIDLIMILRSPFAPHQKRNKIYVILSIIISFVTTVIFKDLLTYPCTAELSKSEHFQVRSTYLFTIILAQQLLSFY